MQRKYSQNFGSVKAYNEGNKSNVSAIDVALLITTFIPKGGRFATLKKEKGKFIFNVFKETYLIYLVVSEEPTFPFHLRMTLINFYSTIFFARRAKGMNRREGGDGAAKFRLLSF